MNAKSYNWLVLVAITATPASAEPYPISGSWAATESDVPAAQSCASYRKDKNDVAGNLIVFNGSKKTEYNGGYLREETVANLSVRKVGENRFQIVDRYYDDGEGGTKPGYKRRPYSLIVIDDTNIELRESGGTPQRYTQCPHDANPAKRMPGSSKSAGPSFDCTKIRYADEAAICNDPKLSELDRLVVAAFNEARSKQPDEVNKRAAVLLAQRHACNADKACIMKRQTESLQYYRRFATAVPLPALATTNETENTQSRVAQVQPSSTPSSTDTQSAFPKGAGSPKAAVSTPPTLEPRLLFAKELDDCEKPQSNFLSLSMNGSVRIGGRSCKISGDGAAPSGSNLEGRLPVSCEDGTSDSLTVSFKKYTFATPIFASVSLGQQAAERFYICASIKKATEDGFKLELVREYKMVLLKDKLKDIYGTYLYVKVCEDNGFTGQGRQVREFLTGIDVIARKSGFDTDKLFAEAAQKMAGDKMFGITKMMAESLRKGAGTSADRMAMLKGCDRFVTLFGTVKSEYDEARAEPTSSFKKDF